MTSVMKESAEIMNQMNSIMNINEMAMTAQQLESEMMKMGVINEQIEDMMDSQNDDLEDDDVEIDNIIEQEQKALGVQNKHFDQNKPMMQEEQKNEFDDLEKRFQNLT